MIYWKADEEILNKVQLAMDQWHHDLAKARVKVGVIMAANPKDGPAVSHGGYPALASIKVVPLKDRITKGYDAEMLVDASFWKTTTEETRMALLDHELSHIEIKKPKERKVDKKKKPEPEADQDDADDGDDDTIAGQSFLVDDIGRPLLKMRKGDWNVGDGFVDVVRRHGVNAIERVNIKQAESMIESIDNGDL
jgi:hypothetical protein